VNEAVDTYLAEMDSVEGWLQPGAADLFCRTDDWQQRWGVVGARVEFGVHHGRSLILMALLDPTTPVLGLDLSDEHVRDNISARGVGNAAMRLGDTNAVTVEVIREELRGLGSDTVRMVSIDGDHTFEGTVHDLQVTAELLCPGGVTIVDDVANPIYPGVHEAVVQVINQGALVPFAAAGGRLAMCLPADIDRWAAAFSGHRLVDVRGWPVAMTTDDAWRQPTLETRALAEGVSLESIMIPARREYAQQLVVSFAQGRVTDGLSLEHWIGEFMRDTGLSREELREIATEVLGREGLDNLRRTWAAREEST